MITKYYFNIQESVSLPDSDISLGRDWILDTTAEKYVSEYGLEKKMVFWVTRC